MPEPVFAIDAYGPYTPDRLRVVWRDECRPSHPVLDAMIERTWAEQVDYARRDGRVLFNGGLVRCLRHRVCDGTLEIEVGPTDYREFMGTNFVNWQRAAEFGPALYSNAVGTSAILTTRDGWIVLGRRSERVACHPGYVHTFGGCIEPGERLADGTFDALASTVRELKEELGIDPADIVEMTCLGLIHDTTIKQPELIFDASLRLSLQDLSGRLRPDDHDEEHTEIVACRDEPAPVIAMLHTTAKLAPVAVGAIVLHVRAALGEDACSHVHAALDP